MYQRNAWRVEAGGKVAGKAIRKEWDPPPLHPAAELNRTNLYFKQGPGEQESSQGELTFAKNCFTQASLLAQVGWLGGSVHQVGPHDTIAH